MEEPIKPTPTEDQLKIAELTAILERTQAIIKSYEFLSDHVQFNLTMFEGLKLLLDKVTKIEAKLNGQKPAVL